MIDKIKTRISHKKINIRGSILRQEYSQIKISNCNKTNMEHKEGENKKDFDQCLDIVVSVKFLKRALIEI